MVKRKFNGGGWREAMTSNAAYGSTSGSTSGSTRANAPPGRSSTGHHPVNQGRPGNQPGGRPNLPSNPMPDPNKARIERELQELLNPQQNTQQDIINRKNAERIARMEQDKKDAAIAAAGREWDPKADDWEKDYSHSTRDVRSTPDEREKFRIETEQVKYEGDKRMTSTGHYVETPAERMALLMSHLTGNPKYANMPIFVPKGVSYEEQEALLKLAETDPQKFIDTVTRFEDITAGNPNQQFQEGFGTGYDEWYTPPAGLDGQNDQGGYYGWDGSGGSQGGSGYGYGYGGDDDPLPRGYQRAKFAPGTLQEQVNQNYMRLAGLRKKRGGIVSLLELR